MLGEHQDRFPLVLWWVPHTASAVSSTSPAAGSGLYFPIRSIGIALAFELRLLDSSVPRRVDRTREPVP